MARSSSYLLFIIQFFIVGHLTTGQVIQSGKCPEVTTQQDFKLDDYMGIWYEYTKYPAKFEEGGKCLYAIYKKMDDGSVSVANTQTKIATSEKSTTLGTGHLVESGKFSVVFPKSKAGAGTNYLILGTNYKDYSLVYYCRQMEDDKNAQLLWILTRERNPTEESLADAYHILDQYKFKKDLLVKTDHTDCPAVEH